MSDDNYALSAVCLLPIAGMGLFGLSFALGAVALLIIGYRLWVDKEIRRRFQRSSSLVFWSIVLFAIGGLFPLLRGSDAYVFLILVAMSISASYFWRRAFDRSRVTSTE